jgi:hypothetical protein
MKYHTTKSQVGEEVAPKDGLYSSSRSGKPSDGDILGFAFDDPRWPTHCVCGMAYLDEDQWQVFKERIYVRKDTGAEMTIHEAPPGAMWNADWWPKPGPDGKCLVVRCPDGHEWMIDGRASNCTDPDDDEHFCWVRTGTPPNITVSKSVPGQKTCRAGGGSIATPGYHGFLRDGSFT